jgi:hypothetical protein
MGGIVCGDFEYEWRGDECTALLACLKI